MNRYERSAAVAGLALLFAIAPVAADGKITPETRGEVIEKLATGLEQRYVFPEVAEKMAATLREKAKSEDLAKLTDGDALAERLTEELQAISKDRHLRVVYRMEGAPPRPEGSPSGEQRETMKRQAAFRNAGFVKIERLTGNVGYMEFRMFMEPEAIADTLEAAMNFLADTDALIIDLRRNGGGSPRGVQLVCSYLFGPEPVHLNSLYFRPADRTEEFWTLKEVPGKRYLDKDVYVLTSGYTFSGAEECAYNLQTRKRATIVGETTGGGAHPGGMVPLNDHFAVFIPTGRAINPVTKTNWEGTGVVPDVKANADEALDVAHKLALKKLDEAADGDEGKDWRTMDLEAEKRFEERFRTRKVRD